MNRPSKICDVVNVARDKHANKENVKNREVLIEEKDNETKNHNFHSEANALLYIDIINHASRFEILKPYSAHPSQNR